MKSKETRLYVGERLQEHFHVCGGSVGFVFIGMLFLISSNSQRQKINKNTVIVSQTIFPRAWWMSQHQGFSSAVLSNSELSQSCQDVGQTPTLWLYRRRGYDVSQRAASWNTDTHSKAEVILLKWRSRSLVQSLIPQKRVFLFHIYVTYKQRKRSSHGMCL